MEYINNYEILFRKFKREHPEKSEKDFVLSQISKFKKDVEEAEKNYNSLDQEEIKKTILQDLQLDFDHFPDKGYQEEFVDWSVQQKLEPLETRIKTGKRMIYEYEIKLSRLPGSFQIKKESETNLLHGKKLNLSERYELAKRIFDIDKEIRKLPVSEGEKDKLLSLILDCSTTNARHILNGKYPGKIREKLVSDYVETLKK